MRNYSLLILIILAVTSFGCDPVMDQPAVIPLTDSSLINPDFGYSTFTPVYTVDEFSLSKTPAGISLFYTYSSYLDAKLYEVTFVGNALNGQTILDSNVYAIPSIDVLYDPLYNINRLTFFYDYPGSTLPDGINVATNQIGGLQKFSVEDVEQTIKTRIVPISNISNKYAAFILCKNHIIYKFVSFTGITNPTQSPPYNPGVFSSIILYNNSFLTEFRDIRTAYNPATSKALVGVNFIGSSQNYLQVLNENGTVGSSILINDKYNDPNTPDFDIVSIDNFFLVAYMSNLNIAQENKGSVVQTGEHLRLKLIDQNGNPVDLNVGSNNPDYVVNEKSIALPQAINASNDVGKICFAKKSNSEVGLAFVRDNVLYFTRIVYNQNKLSISPLLLVDEGMDPGYYTQLKMHWDGVYRIAYYNPLAAANNFQVYVSN